MLPVARHGQPGIKAQRMKPVHLRAKIAEQRRFAPAGRRERSVSVALAGLGRFIRLDVEFPGERANNVN